MEQGYYITITNSVTMVRFAAIDNILIKVVSPSKEAKDVSIINKLEAVS
jgi:hypothetical protein